MKVTEMIWNNVKLLKINRITYILIWQSKITQNNIKSYILEHSKYHEIQLTNMKYCKLS